MATGGMFGAPMGDLGFAQLQDTQAQTQERAAQIQHINALTQNTYSEMQDRQRKAAQEQKMLELFARGPQTTGKDGEGNPITQGDALEELGGRMVQSGFVKQGMDILNKASEIRTRESSQRIAAAKAAQEIIDKKAKAYESFNNFLAGAHDRPSWEIAIQAWKAENPGIPVPPGMEQYNPQLIDILKTVTKTGQKESHEDAVQNQRDVMNAWREDQLASRERHNEVMESVSLAREALAERRESRREKAGGAKVGKVGNATNEDILAAHQMILRGHPDINPDLSVGKDNLVSSYAYEMANEAEALMARNKGLSKVEAMHQVYDRMDKAKVFDAPGAKMPPKEPSWATKRLSELTDALGIGKKSESTKGLGSSPKTPAPLPPKGSPLKDGVYYKTPRGIVKWNAAKGKAELQNGQ